MDIGNGYGVVGGGAYGEAEARRRGTFSLAAEPAFLANPGRDRERQQSDSESKGNQEKRVGDSGGGAQPGSRGSSGAEGPTGTSPGAKATAKGTPSAIPEFLAKRLRARGILKDQPPSTAPDTAQVRASSHLLLASCFSASISLSVSYPLCCSGVSLL